MRPTSRLQGRRAERHNTFPLSLFCYPGLQLIGQGPPAWRAAVGWTEPAHAQRMLHTQRHRLAVTSTHVRQPRTRPDPHCSPHDPRGRPSARTDPAASRTSCGCRPAAGSPSVTSSDQTASAFPLRVVLTHPQTPWSCRSGCRGVVCGERPPNAAATRVPRTAVPAPAPARSGRTSPTGVQLSRHTWILDTFQAVPVYVTGQCPVTCSARTELD